MFALRTVASRMAQANSTMVVAKRTTVIAGPARNKVSFAEKLAHGFVIIGSIMFVPAYILANIKHYRGREE